MMAAVVTLSFTCTFFLLTQRCKICTRTSTKHCEIWHCTVFSYIPKEQTPCNAKLRGPTLSPKGYFLIPGIDKNINWKWPGSFSLERHHFYYCPLPSNQLLPVLCQYTLFTGRWHAFTTLFHYSQNRHKNHFWQEKDNYISQVNYGMGTLCHGWWKPDLIIRQPWRGFKGISRGPVTL